VRSFRTPLTIDFAGTGLSSRNSSSKGLPGKPLGVLPPAVLVWCKRSEELARELRISFPAPLQPYAK
jgi:hypothetical protein